MARLLPIGTRLMLSAPPATTTSHAPAMISPTATLTAASEEPHLRSTVLPGMFSGQHAPSNEVRSILALCSPLWVKQPKTSSSTTNSEENTYDIQAHIPNQNAEFYLQK